MWNLENMQVCGKYMGVIPVSGRVVLSRVAYGGDIKHTIELDQPVNVYGAIRDRVILEHCFVDSVADNAAFSA